MEENNNKHNKIFIPIAIIIAGLIIAVAVFFAGKDNKQAEPRGEANPAEEVSVSPVSEKDHILGSPDAEIFVIEYSDFECPFCGRFHPTMEQIIAEYGDSGKVAWVYRHFPLDQIHRLARPASEASECVAELGGNAAFWEYADHLFRDTPASLTPDQLLAHAVSVGVDEAALNECVASGRHAQTVEDFYQDGLALAQADPQFGTPYSIILGKDGTQIAVPGAQPYSVLKEVIDTILAGNAQ